MKIKRHLLALPQLGGPCRSSASVLPAPCRPSARRAAARAARAPAPARCRAASDRRARGFAEITGRLVGEPEHRPSLRRPGRGIRPAESAGRALAHAHDALAPRPRISSHRQRREDARDLERAADAAPHDLGAARGRRCPRRRAGCARIRANAPEIRLKNVVLPAPFGPITAVSEPVGKSSVTSLHRGDAAEGLSRGASTCSMVSLLRLRLGNHSGAFDTRSAWRRRGPSTHAGATDRAPSRAVRAAGRARTAGS